MASQDLVNWTDVFPFEDPYEHQQNGIESAIQTAKGGGYSVIEGACGTGKTLLSLTVGISLVRDPSTKYEQIVAVTNVKQQQEAFQDDLQTINQRARNGSLPISPVSGLTLVGKGDVCAYHVGGNWTYDDVYEYCSGLRERTRELIADRHAGEHQAASELVEEASSDITDQLSLGGTRSPFPDEPTVDDSTSYCPFYAQSQADSAAEVQRVQANDRLLTPERLVQTAIDAGTCPHTSMRSLLDDVEIVIGNYQHIFSPQTVQMFSHPVINDETFLIVDEAHGLVTDLRDQFSYSIEKWELISAIEELDHVRATISTGTTEGDLIEKVCRQQGYDTGDIDALFEFLTETREFINELIQSTSADDFTSGPSPRTPLRDPEEPEQDEFTEWAAEYHPGVLESAYELGSTITAAASKVRTALDRADFEPEYIEEVGRVLTRWQQLNHTTYYRDLEIDADEPTDPPSAAEGWVLWIRNCLPTARLSSRLGDFGGGVIMSATIQPMEMFTDLLGVHFLDSTIETQTYPLTFPESNRSSYVVDLPPFTYDNRGQVPDTPSGRPEKNDVRREYADALSEFCDVVPGNVLIATPSYSEAKWVSDTLERRGVDKEIFTDSSSSREETIALREDFFESSNGVLTTSLRGTLTEGVDYSGDRLRGVAVVGVPMLNPTSPRNKALLNAYEEEFGGAAFQYGFTIPAVWKVRQALGRVIRGDSDTGVRVLLDERYDPNSGSAVSAAIPDSLGEELLIEERNEVMSAIRNDFDKWEC